MCQNGVLAATSCSEQGITSSNKTSTSLCAPVFQLQSTFRETGSQMQPVCVRTGSGIHVGNMRGAAAGVAAGSAAGQPLLVVVAQPLLVSVVQAAHTTNA